MFAITPTKLPDVLLVEVPIYSDDRGYFEEVWHHAKHTSGGVPERFVQDNLSFSKRGVVRGLHFQNPQPQGKLVCVLQGTIYDVAVDIRVGSPRFGQHVGVTLSAETNQRVSGPEGFAIDDEEITVASGPVGQQLYVPEGFAHGFAVLSKTALVLYKCTAPYNAGADASVLWNDPDLGIAWLVDAPLLSGKDAAAPRLVDIARERLPRYEC